MNDKQRRTELAPDTAAYFTPPMEKCVNVKLTGAGTGPN